MHCSPSSVVSLASGTFLGWETGTRILLMPAVGRDRVVVRNREEGGWSLVLDGIWASVGRAL